jgi:uncharacterized membrane protein
MSGISFILFSVFLSVIEKWQHEFSFYVVMNVFHFLSVFLRFISLSKRTSNENLMKQKMLLPQWCLQKSSNRFLLIFDEINISEEQTFLAFAAFVLVVRLFQNRTFSFWID